MPDTTRRFLAVLVTHRLTGVAGWSVVCRVPPYAMTLGLVLVVREQGGSFGQAGLIAALYTLGRAGGGPVMARQMDRGRHRQILAGTAVTYVAAVAGLAWATEPATLAQALLAFLAGLSVPPANAFMRSLWSRLPLRDEDRDVAYLWEAVLVEFLVIGGPLLIGGLMVFGSAVLAATVIGAVGGLGAIALAVGRLPAALLDGGTGRGTRSSDPLGPLRHRRVLVLIGLIGVCAVPHGVMELAIPAFMDQQGHPAQTGLVYASWALGSAVIALCVGGRQSQVQAVRRLPWLVLATALGIGLTAFAGSPAVLALTLAVGGAPIALQTANEFALISTVAEDHLLAETFAWASVAYVVGSAVGQQIGGLLVGPAGPRWVFAAAFALGLGAAAAAFPACAALRRFPQGTRRFTAA